LCIQNQTTETGTGTKPMSKDDNKEVVTTDELIMAQMIRLDAIAQLLIEKGVVSEEEFYSKLKNVQAQYQDVSES
jgi:hypothetical protein